MAHGCAGVLALPPFYYKTITDDGLFAFFSELIERVGDARLRVYLYHIPPVAHVGFRTRWWNGCSRVIPSSSRA